MSIQPLNNDLRELLECCFASAEALDVLFTLRSDAGRWWTSEEVLRATSATAERVREALIALQESGLVLQLGPSQFCSAPLEPLAQQAMAQLESVYVNDRAALVQHLTRC